MTQVVTLFGIKSCDTVRKARRFLEQNTVQFSFHDWRADGVDSQLLTQAAQTLGWDALVNKRSTTWRTLDEATRQRPAAELLAEHPTLIKRPLLKLENNQFVLGFKAANWQQELGL